MEKILANTVYSDSTLKRWKKEDLIEHIRILEHNWASAEDSLANSVKNSEKIFFEQKAEIERLTGERERVAWQKQEYLDWVHGLLSTHTEMKDRGEDYKMFDRDWLCDILWLKIEPFYATIFDLERQRNELQKQVDELKKRLVDEFEAFKFEAYGKVKQQAVKNAVEETVQHFWEKFAGNCEMWISDEIERYAKEKGVEVE